MSLKQRVLEYIQKKCIEGGGKAETGPRIYTIARELNADVEEVTKVIKELEKEAVVEFRSSPSGDTYICPLMTEDEVLKLRIIELLKEQTKLGIQKIAELLGEDRNRISNLIKELNKEGKVKFAGEAGASWVELT